MNMHVVKLTKQAEKDLKKVPLHIAGKFQLWLDLVESETIRTARQIRSFHDEPLKGQRKGQRSIRLNKAYRAIYVEKSNGTRTRGFYAAEYCAFNSISALKKQKNARISPASSALFCLEL